MEHERWQRAADLYQSAQGRSPEDRWSFLRQATEGDSDLRREVESLLAQDAESVVLDQAIGDVALPLFADNSPVQPGSSLGSTGSTACQPARSLRWPVVAR